MLLVPSSGKIIPTVVVVEGGRVHLAGEKTSTLLFLRSRSCLRLHCAYYIIFIMPARYHEQDPAVPGLAREIWKVLKRKLLSYLGQEASTTQENPSTSFLGGSDPSLTPSLRRNGRRRESSSWIGDDDDVVYWASDEGTKRFAARTTGPSTISPECSPYVHPERLPTDYQPLVLHEYAPYARHAPEEEWSVRETRQESSSIRARAETTAPFSSNLHVERESWRTTPPMPEEIKEGGLITSESAVDAPPMLTSMGQAQRAANISNNNYGGFETKGSLRWGCESLAGSQHAQQTTMTAHGNGTHKDTQSREKPIRMRRSRGGVETFNKHGYSEAQGT